MAGRGKMETSIDATSTTLLNRAFKAATARCLTCGVIRVATERRIAPTIRTSVNMTSRVRRRRTAAKVALSFEAGSKLCTCGTRCSLADAVGLNRQGDDRRAGAAPAIAND